MPSTQQIQAGDNRGCKMDGVRAKANALSSLSAEACAHDRRRFKC